MKLFGVVAPRLVCLVALGLLAGCGGHGNTRPASSLSQKDRTALDNYEAVRAALANDDVRAAQKAAATMAAALKPADAKDEKAAPPLFEAANAVAKAPALDLARQRFKVLSDQIVPLAQGVEGYFVMTCAMPSAGDWVQRTKDVDNPYFGRVMHSVGDLKK